MRRYRGEGRVRTMGRGRPRMPIPYRLWRQAGELTPADGTSAFSDIVIIGAGASGTMTAIHLLRQARCAFRITLLSGEGAPGEGTAYATDRAEHLLNVPADQMSLDPKDPGDFVRYLEQYTSESPLGSVGPHFAQRRHYASYLRHRLDESARLSEAKLDLVGERAVSIAECRHDYHHGLQVGLTSGEIVATRRCVLALGHAAKPLPSRLIEHESCLVLSAWDYKAIAQIDPLAEVLVVGAGLSMVDSVATLAATQHRGQICVVSRRGLMPLAYGSPTVTPIDVADLVKLDLRGRVRRLRQMAETSATHGSTWQDLMAGLRLHATLLWQTLSFEDQRVFLRHLRPYWNLHRHRVPDRALRDVRDLIKRKQLSFHIATVAPDCSPSQVGTATRDDHSTATMSGTWGVIINATGPQILAGASGCPLTKALLRVGLACPGPHGVGLDVGLTGQLVSAAGIEAPDIYVIGPQRIGQLLEATSIPELRQQAYDIARELTGTSG